MCALIWAPLYHGLSPNQIDFGRDKWGSCPPRPQTRMCPDSIAFFDKIESTQGKFQTFVANSGRLLV